MADLVRYHLEQSVPELEDLRDRGIFEKNEITMLMRRRTDYEHRITGRGAGPRDFVKYAEFEMNLEKLRQLRKKRLQTVRLVDKRTTLSDHAGVRRIMYIYQRATRRFPGEVSLWSDYLRYAKEFGAVTVVYRVYSKLLQLQPRNVDAWISAAKYEFEDNMNALGARLLFQRGLRLNSDSLELWLAYAQFELTYVSKLLARRKVLGLITEKQQMDEHNYEKQQLQKAIDKSNRMMNGGFEENEDEIALPSTSDIKDELNHLPEADMNMLGNPETNPALKGDVFLAVFDVCIPAVLKYVPKSGRVSETDRMFQIVNLFLQLIDKFPDLNRLYLYMHILNYLQTNHPNDARTMLADVTMPVRTVGLRDDELAAHLQEAVNKFIAYKAKTRDAKVKQELTDSFVLVLEKQFLADDALAEDDMKDVRTLLRAIVRKCKE